MLEPGAPLFKSYGRYLPFAALLPFSSLQVVSKLRMWGWQGKGDFLEQEQKTSDCSLAVGLLPPAGISGEGLRAGGRWMTCQVWSVPS